ncbi:transglycosylase SLT domain-containing protein [Paraburkholderia sp. 2C]
MTGKNKIIKTQKARLTPTSDTTPVTVCIDDSGRLREIRRSVEANNRSGLDDNLIICQIYMESRFDRNASASGSSARGLMQLLKVSVRELYRIRNNRLPRSSRKTEDTLDAEADRLHDSAQFVEDATNIQTGTEYLALLLRNAQGWPTRRWRHTSSIAASLTTSITGR